MIARVWASEPLILSMLGSGAVWAAVFAVAAAFNHPLSPQQQTASLALVGIIGGFIGRSQVSPVEPPQTVDLSKVGKP